MPAKPSGAVKTRTIKNTRKNGDIYIPERQTLYDPVKKQTRIISSKLVSKIPKGTEVPVKTRPKAAHSSKVRNSSAQTSRFSSQ